MKTIYWLDSQADIIYKSSLNGSNHEVFAYNVQGKIPFLRNFKLKVSLRNFSTVTIVTMNNSSTLLKVLWLVYTK